MAHSVNNVDMTTHRSMKNTTSALRFSRRLRRTWYAIGIGTWLSGVLWLIFHEFLARPSEFGVSPNPLEPWWLRLHGAFAFAALWLLGIVSALHIPPGWRTDRRRWSGGWLVAVIAWLILTGYLLYYVGADGPLAVIVVLHWAVGLAAPLAYLLHRAGTRTRGHAR